MAVKFHSLQQEVTSHIVWKELLSLS